MNKRNIKSNQGVIMLYQLNYDKLWQFLGLIAGIVLILVDSCQNHVDSCRARVDSCRARVLQ